MLSYLKGCLIYSQKSANNRVLVTIDVNSIGYDVQITSRQWQTLPPPGEVVQVFTHLSAREDQVTLFGFASGAERDVFRQLISVSGIGPQLAMALLDTLTLQDLISAIVSGNTRLLSKTPGVGGKTAERIALELKTKLSEWRSNSGLTATPSAGPVASIQEDVEMTLLALGYSNSEITKALTAVGESTTLSKTADAEEWIRRSIGWLSQ